MAEIVPAIIPRSLAHARDALTMMREFASSVQIDVVDQTFVTEASWPYGDNEATGDPAELAGATAGLTVEVDLMVEQPEERIDAWKNAGVARIVVHIETVRDFDTLAMHRQAHGYLLGLAFGNDTPLTVVEPHFAAVDFVQCMGIATIGAQGFPFDERVLERIAALKAMHPDLPVSVDGSVNEETLPGLRAAGADRFVVGSAIVNADDPRAAYERLRALAA